MIAFHRVALAVSFLAVLLTAGTANGQESSIFGGYSYLRDIDVQVNRHGWNGALALGLAPRLQFLVDSSGHYNSIPNLDIGESLHVVQVGPQLILVPGATLQPFFRGMIGAGRFSRVQIHDWGVTFTVGGGIDWRFSDGGAIRVLQADYLILRKPGEYTADTVRLSAGLVLHFGE